MLKVPASDPDEHEKFFRLMRGPTGHDERLVPEVADPGNLAQHLKRYHFALPYCRDRLVLDAGAGVGYGPALLGGYAKKVYAFDYDTEATRYARERFGSDRVEFLTGDVAVVPFRNDTFDVVVSFEVIEHVPDHERFLGEICRIMKPTGTLLVSTPNKVTSGLFRRKAGFTYDAHVSEVGLAEFRRELQARFASVDLLGMRTRGNTLYSLVRALDPWNLRLRLASARQIQFARTTLFSVPWERVTLDDVVLSPRHLRQANHFLAVCEGKRS